MTPESTRVILVLSAWCCLHLTNGLEAQRPPDAFESLRAGDLIRLRTYSHGLHVGTVLRIGPDSVYLEPRDGSSQVAAAALMSWGVCDAAHCSVDPEAVTVGGITGAVMGAITGVIIGAMFGQWHQIHP